MYIEIIPHTLRRWRCCFCNF